MDLAEHLPNTLAIEFVITYGVESAGARSRTTRHLRKGFPMTNRRTNREITLNLFVVAFLCLLQIPSSPAAGQDRGDNTLRKLNESVDLLIKKVSPSVVQILVTGYGPIDSGEHGNTAGVIGT